MKTIDNSSKTFEAVPFMRQQRDRLSEMMSKMNKTEIVEHFRRKAVETTIKPYC